MAEARRRAPDLIGPTWIMANSQTAASGRRGRPWTMSAGNFAATLFMRPNCDAGTAAMRSFVAALALRQTLAMSVSSDTLSLKWPNDVLLNGGKVAGILLESSGTGARIEWLAIGIGVNLAVAPSSTEVEEGAVPPISLAQVNPQVVSPPDFLFWLASHFADLERLFTEFGFESIRRLWLRHAARLGQTITARLPHEEVTGIFETVDMDGNLVLTTGTSRRAIPAAEVYF